MKDYVEEDDEEAVLSRWERSKKWIEIALATKKLSMLVWTMVFGVGGTMAVGTVTDTNPLRDAAIRTGVIQPQVVAVEDETIPEHTHPLPDHTHDHEHDFTHTHDLSHEHEPVGLAAHNHDHTHPAVDHSHSMAEHTHPERVQISEAGIQGMIDDALNEAVPPDHRHLH